MIEVSSKDSKNEVLTKRKKRKAGSNSSTKWQQQPAIKSMVARNNAYLRNAGFTKSKESKEVMDPQKDFINSPECKFGRLLASPETKIRHATILKLKQYLTLRTEPKNKEGGLSLLDLMKLWKGLWYTLYLCDGAVVQEEVSKVLVGLIWAVGGTIEEDEYAGRVYLELGEETYMHMEADETSASNDDEQPEEILDKEGDERINDKTISHNINNLHSSDGIDHNFAQEEDVKHCRGAHLSSLFVRTYFRTLVREWSNMDKYRIDKFYTLTRLVLREVYRYVASRHWNLGIIRLFNDALYEEVLKINNFGNGVRFHLMDICMDELALVNSENSTGISLTEATFLDCLEPFFAMLQRCDSSLLHQRVIEKVILKFLEVYSVVGDNAVYAEESKKMPIMDNVHVGTVAQFIFELASDTETEDRYRAQLYEIHKTFIRKIKKVGRDVDIMDVSDLHDIDDDEYEEQEFKKVNTEATFTQVDVNALKLERNVVEETDNHMKKNLLVKVEQSKEELFSLTNGNGLGVKRNPMENNLRELSGEEEIVTISLKEQRKAADAVMKAAKDAQRSPTKNGSFPNRRKVKFGKLNTSKSYKASMRALNKVDPKEILEKTPEKSILLKRKKLIKKRKKNSTR